MPTRSLAVLSLVLLACAVPDAPWPPGDERPDDPMAAAAVDLLMALDEPQRDAVHHAFAHSERHNWQPVPFGDAGVRLDALDDAQREHVRALLAGALSEPGLAMVDGVIVLETILVAIEAEQGRPSRYHGPGRYFVTVYGDPSGDTPWAWRLEGHHLSITFTCRNDDWVAHGPLFVGAQPARVQGGEHDGFRLLGPHDDGVRTLLASLDDEQRARAVVDDDHPIPGNVLLTPGEDEGFDDERGLPGSALTDSQRALLGAALEHWITWLRPDLADAERARVHATLDETRLLWIGGTDVDAPHYWRLVGPHAALEYAAPERDPDHVHALWRDPTRDFGGDLLREHLRQHHGEASGDR